MVVTVNDIDLAAKGFAQATAAYGVRQPLPPPLAAAATAPTALAETGLYGGLRR